MGPEGFRPAIRRCRNFSTAVMPDQDKVPALTTAPALDVQLASICNRTSYKGLVTETILRGYGTGP